VELGSSKMNVQDVLKLGSGSVVGLNSLIGDPVNVFVNDRLVARGEVLVVKDNIAVRITEVVPAQKAGA
jgi:flagellar motor switch protein FliN/FliY